MAHYLGMGGLARELLLRYDVRTIALLLTICKVETCERRVLNDPETSDIAQNSADAMVESINVLQTG